MAVAKKKTTTTPNVLAEVIRGIFEVLATAIDRFGWPGAAVILVYAFVERYASLAQKREFINLLLHPHEKGAQAFLFLLIIGIGIFGAQHYYWKKRDLAKDAEIKRLADWKSQQQQRQIPVKLHHTKDEDAGRSPKIPRTRRQRNK